MMTDMGIPVDPPQPTIKELVEDAINRKHVTSIEEFTCYNCTMFNRCEFAFDHYNTNGDCLAEK